MKGIIIGKYIWSSFVCRENHLDSVVWL